MISWIGKIPVVERGNGDAMLHIVLHIVDERGMIAISNNTRNNQL